MAISQTLCTSFKLGLLNGETNFTTDTFRVALYTSAADLNETTTSYTGTTNEVANGNGYGQGGKPLSVVGPTTTGTTAYVTFGNVSWDNSTITARGALIYKSGGTNPAVAVLDFGADKTTSNSSFTVTFPTSNATSAIIRIE
jgi:hypothetical protein